MEGIVPAGDMILKYMSVKEKAFVESYVRNKGVTKDTAKDLGISIPMVGKYLAKQKVIDYLSSLKGKLKQDVTQDISYEWILTEYQNLYNKLKESEDDRAAAGVLDKITNFKQKYGKYVDEESMRVAKLDLQGLLKYIESMYKSIKDDVKSKIWTEKDASEFEYKEADK